MARIVRMRADGPAAVVATYGDRVVGHASWRRLAGPRAQAEIEVESEFARGPLAAHLLVRLARLADAVVALPALRGPALPGVPADARGFIPTDDHGRVRGLEGVYAAGDAAAFPVKQGGLAAQQADAVAEAVAAAFGAPIAPRPFRPVLRGLLLTGGEDRFLRAALGGGGEGDAEAVGTALWSPPTKVAVLYLAPYLAGR